MKYDLCRGMGIDVFELNVQADRAICEMLI
jgi:hypothetical protein